MPNPLLPLSAQLLLSGVLVVVLGVHLRHAARASGETRGWHVVHVVMALGMLDMSLPGGRTPVPMGALQLGFLVLTVVVLTVAVARLSPLWCVTGFGVLGMLVMSSVPMAPSTAWRVSALVTAGWFVVDTVGWASGALLPQVHRLGGSSCAPAAGMVLGGGSPTPAVGSRPHGRSMRLALAAMGLAMAYLMVGASLGATNATVVPAGVTSIEHLSGGHGGMSGMSGMGR